MYLILPFFSEIGPGLVLKLEYLKDQYLDQCYFISYYISDDLTTNKLFTDDTFFCSSQFEYVCN